MAEYDLEGSLDYMYFPLPFVDAEIGFIKDLVMTACKRGQETLVRIDRLKHSLVDVSKAHHVAEGPFRGIIINESVKGLPEVEKPDVQMEFSVTITNVKRKQGVEGSENRQVRFWFKPQAPSRDRSTNAKDYFKALLQPEHFPRDYVNFIKKAIVLAQHFPAVKRIELSMKPDVRDSGFVDSAEQQIAPVAASAVHAEPPLPPPTVGPDGRFTQHLKDDIIEDDDADADDVIENFITVMTPALYDYQYLPEVPVSDKVFVNFSIKAKSDAHIALSSVYGDTERKTYEIVIGGQDNTKSVIRDGGQGTTVEEAVTLKILDEDDARNFWLSWDRGMVQVGEGRRRGLDTFLRWKVPPNKQHSVNCIAVSTGPGSKGTWEFVELIRPLKPEDTTKQARRARFRMSLLWLAKKQKMLQVLEDAYPNSVVTAELLRMSNIKLFDMMTAVVFLKDLQKRGLITEVTRGIWMRSPGSSPDNTHVVKMVDESPVLTGRETPTVAVITSMYCEKLAVDAMMENKVSYVQYKTEGESQVYTIGRIGHNQVVSTKLSRVGSKSGAAISAGNTVTRLLGIFDQVEHIFVVGCGGAVPDYHDYSKHVRLGDIVVATPYRPDGPVYIHCENLNRKGEGQDNYEYQVKNWYVKDATLQSVAKQLKTHEHSMRVPWARFIEEGSERLHAEESDFHRPPAKKDKLYATIDNEVVQVEHPRPPGPRSMDLDNKSRLRYGPVGSSKFIARNDRIRLDFAKRYNTVAYDGEFGAVLDAIEGSRNQSYLVIRGVADYVDGTKNKEWQPHASLAAAAYMKAVITAMPTLRRSSNY